MRFSVNVEMKDRWVPAFIGMLKRMEACGRIGASREVAIYADGDGDFSPSFSFTCEDELPNAASPVRDSDGNQLFDAG